MDKRETSTVLFMDGREVRLETRTALYIDGEYITDNLVIKKDSPANLISSQLIDKIEGVNMHEEYRYCPKVVEAVAKGYKAAIGNFESTAEIRILDTSGRILRSTTRRMSFYIYWSETDRVIVQRS